MICSNTHQMLMKTICSHFVIIIVFYYYECSCGHVVAPYNSKLTSAYIVLYTVVSIIIFIIFFILWPRVCPFLCTCCVCNGFLNAELLLSGKCKLMYILLEIYLNIEPLSTCRVYVVRTADGSNENRHEHVYCYAFKWNTYLWNNRPRNVNILNVNTHLITVFAHKNIQITLFNSNCFRWVTFKMHFIMSSLNTIVNLNVPFFKWDLFEFFFSFQTARLQSPYGLFAITFRISIVKPTLTSIIIIGVLK